MNNEQDNSLTKGLFLGFVAGGAIGAILALLFAPKPGRELRRSIRDQKDRLVDKAGELLNATPQSVDDFLNRERERSRQVVSSAKDRAQSIMQNADRSLNDARSRASSVIDTVRDAQSKIQDASKAGMDAFRDELKNG